MAGPCTSALTAASSTDCMSFLLPPTVRWGRSVADGAERAHLREQHGELGHVIVALEQNRQRARALEREGEQLEHLGHHGRAMRVENQTRRRPRVPGDVELDGAFERK